MADPRRPSPGEKGKSRCASASLMTTTFDFSRISRSVKRRPLSSGMPERLEICRHRTHRGVRAQRRARRRQLAARRSISKFVRRRRSRGQMTADDADRLESSTPGTAATRRSRHRRRTAVSCQARFNKLACGQGDAHRQDVACSVRDRRNAGKRAARSSGPRRRAARPPARLSGHDERPAQPAGGARAAADPTCRAIRP